MTGRITGVTRRRIIARLDGGSWSGDLDEEKFLERLYPLDDLPSYDDRFTTARDDVIQHCMRNYDWPDEWIYDDPRFGLATDDTALLSFLAEMLHPEVRDDSDEARRLATSLTALLAHDGYEIVQVDAISGAPVFAGRRIGGGVAGTMKNLIFAADGPKPELVLDDALNNDIRITKNAQFCLVYDRPLPTAGLTWADLCSWWAQRQNLTTSLIRDVGLDLHERLCRSLQGNEAELLILHTYARRYRALGFDIPALLPQVYLHYDPYTAISRGASGSPLPRQRMDFLLLLPHNTRIVIELDGKHHYAADEHADPRRYAAMVAEDRELRLRGYEVYRFGGAELTERTAAAADLEEFFDRLAERHRSR